MNDSAKPPKAEKTGASPAARPLFTKILIANRGEIACRIMRTARAMGIATVAVYSEADADAAHVREADEAVPIGPAPSAKSYLVIEQHLKALPRRRGAEAVHPGYGFLSENAPSPAALEKAGIVFIGPPASRHRRHGRQDRIQEAGRRRPASATVPGHLGVIKDAEEAVKIARTHRLSGDDQGLGRRRRQGHARRPQRRASSARASAPPPAKRDRASATTGCSSRNTSRSRAISKSRCWPMPTARCLYLGERECSIQRRHQKVIEEAPSPFLDAKTRAAMGEQAVALAKAVGYRSAGTVEFIVDRQAQLLLPGDEHPAPGRASGDRARDRHRSGRADDPHRRRREADPARRRT